MAHRKYMQRRSPITSERSFAGGLARTIDTFVDVKATKKTAFYIPKK